MLCVLLTTYEIYSPERLAVFMSYTRYLTRASGWKKTHNQISMTHYLFSIQEDEEVQGNIPSRVNQNN